MGVQFSDTAATWTYEEFHIFRVKLAQEIGISLDLMDGYTQGRGLRWNSVSDPIKSLLACEDVGGTFTPAQCAQMAVRLKQLTATWSDKDSDKHKASSLSRLMAGHVQFGLPLVF